MFTNTFPLETIINPKGVYAFIRVEQPKNGRILINGVQSSYYKIKLGTKITITAESDDNSAIDSINIRYN